MIRVTSLIVQRDDNNFTGGSQLDAGHGVPTEPLEPMMRLNTQDNQVKTMLSGVINDDLVGVTRDDGCFELEGGTEIALDCVKKTRCPGCRSLGNDRPIGWTDAGHNGDEIDYLQQCNGVVVVRQFKSVFDCLDGAI